MDRIRLTYTPYGGSSTDMDLELLGIRGAAEPDNVGVFPDVKHNFLDGSLAEQIAGGRRNIEAMLKVIDSPANRRRLAQFWLDPDREIASLCARPGNFAAAKAAGGSLTGALHTYTVCAIDAVGHGIAAFEDSDTTSGADLSMALSWDAVTNARCYKIFRKIAAGHWFVLDYTTELTYVDDGTAVPLLDLDAVEPPAAVSTISVVRGSDNLESNWDNDFEGARSYVLPLVEASIWHDPCEVM